MRRYIDKLETNDQLYSKVLKYVNDGIMFTDINSRIIDVNQAFLNITGYEEAEVIGESPSILSSGIHDKQFYEEMWLNIYEKGKWEGEIWNKKKNGDIYLEKLNINSIHDQSGMKIGYIGIISDVTKLRQNESDVRLYERVFKNSSEGIMITDIDGKIISVNPGFTETTGYKQDEVIGESPNILNSGRHDQNFYSNMWASIHDHGIWQGEIWNRRKNGEIYPEWLTINAVKDEKGKLTNYVAIFTDITQQKIPKAYQDTQLAHYDTLTGLPNRFLFYAELSQAMKESAFSNYMTVVLYLDIDRLKLFNDTFDYATGDQLIIEVSNRLRKFLDDSILVSRLGGDEFTILMKKVDDLRKIEETISLIQDKVMQPFYVKSMDLHVTCSIGVSVYPFDGQHVDTLIKNASTAMNKAKTTNKGYKYFEGQMAENTVKKMEIVNDLQMAMKQNEFIVFYQPQVEIESGGLVGLEALIRWRSIEKGMISPGDFIPIAEETGQIVQIGKWVLQEVCSQLIEWEKEGIPLVKVAVNVSAKNFTDETFVNFVSKVLRETNVDPSLIELEITESVSAIDTERVIKILQDLKTLGVNVAIDDFGTGHSSLSYIRNFPVNSLKIDRSFIRNVHLDKVNTSIIKAIMNMAEGLGLKVVAEGVENKSELEFLNKLQCTYVQGYLYAKPMPAEDIQEILKIGKIDINNKNASSFR